MADGPALQRKGVVEDELKSLDRIAACLAEGLAEMSDPTRQLQLRAIAVWLSRVYTGVESSLEGIIDRFGEAKPIGAD